jgi:putative aldouronate transport system substrate-binding protein
MMFSLAPAFAAELDTEGRPYELPVTDEPISVTLYMAMESGSELRIETYEQHTAIIEWGKRVGLDFKFVHPPMNDDGTYFNMIVASGDYPDGWITSNFDTYYPGATDGAIQDGIIADPNALIDQYGYHYVIERAKWDDAVKRNMKTDEGTWRFGAANQRYPVLGMVHAGPIVRKDLLGEYGLDSPTTLDEVTEMLRAFKANGVEVPLALHRMRDGYYGDSSFLSWMYGVIDPGGTGVSRHFILDEDLETVIYSPAQPGYKDYIAQLSSWYQEGLIDRDFVNRSQEDTRKLFSSGRAGMIFLGNWQTKEVLQVGQVDNPSFDLMGITAPALTADDLGKENPFTQPIVNGTNGQWWLISESSPHKEELFKALDYLYSYEGTELMVFGVNELEDGSVIHTTLEDGTRQFSDYILNNPDLAYNSIRYVYTIQALSSEYSTDMEIQQYNSPWQQQCWDAWTANATNARRLPARISLTADESREIVPIMNSIDTFLVDKQLKIICGDEPIENWDGYIAQLDSFGVARVQEIMQEAFNRYQVR